MKLSVGDAAPDFTLGSVNRGVISLMDHSGSRVLLVFSRYFWCPVCKMEFDELTRLAAESPALKIIYVTQSTPDSAKSCLAGRDPGFPVVPASRSGDGYPLYDQYGAGKIGR